MKTYTIENGRVTEGIIVIPRVLSSGITIPAVVVGETGRGRKIGFLPVELTNSRQTFDENGEATVHHCSVGKTLKGGHKLIEHQDNGDESKCLVVMRTGIGFRGTNFHTGDRVAGSDTFLPFPCEILTEGVIAQGDAGRMGNGKQMVVIAPRGVVFRASRAGRLYGQPGSHYYIFTGDKILCATWEERVASEIF
jgi:hypothetical protein